MSLPSGYTTSTNVSGSTYTTNLYYNGTLVAALSCDTQTWVTTFHDYQDNRVWSTTSPVGLQPGATWNLAANASGTANSSGSQLSGVCGSGSGYFLYGIDSSSGDYYSQHYHPTFYTSAQYVASGIASGRTGGGSGCGTTVCKNSGTLPGHGHGMHGGVTTAVSAACVEAIVGAGFGAIGLPASVAGILSGALAPIAIAGLISSHVELLWSISMVYAHCL